MDTSPVVTGPRERVRPPRRRRTSRFLAVVPAVVVLVAVSLLALGSEPIVPVFTASGRAAIKPAAPGWRWEMWANVQLQVPDVWDRSQDLRRACYIEEPIDGFVFRPREMVIMETCQDWAQAPTHFPNLAFLDDFPGTPGLGTRTYPNGTVTVERIGAVPVMVTTSTAATSRQILGSAEIVTTDNAAGCPASVRVPTLAHAPATGPAISEVADIELVSVCRYHENAVSYSYTESGAEAAAAVASLQAAPAGAGPDDSHDCEADAPEVQVGLYRLWSGNAATDVWVHWDPCRGHGVDDGVGTRALTADVLAPFIGVAFDGGVSKSVPIRTASTRPGRWPVYVP